MSEPLLEPEALMAAAQAETGLSNFGGDDFRAGLQALCDTYNGAYNERGRRRSGHRLHQLLTTRLKIQEAFRKSPEILEHPVAKPMFLTGLPRSGTSAQFNLLARDPAVRPLLLWEATFPDPIPLQPGQGDPRREALANIVEEQRKKNPDFTKMHFASPDTPEECVIIQAFAFHGVQMGIEIMCEPYGSWFKSQDLRSFYRYYRTLLQLVDWQRPGERWLLKAPAHMWAIEPLLEVFPDARVVWSHRDPLACTASICSMTYELIHRNVDIEKVDLGPIVFDWYASSLERGLSERDRSDPAHFVDVHHDDFVADSLGTAEKVYGHFGMELGAEARAAMEAHVASNPKGKHGKHEYALAEYGLGESEVRARFAPYIERFQLDRR